MRESVRTLIARRVSLRRQRELAVSYRESYTTRVRGGNINLEQFRTALSALGYLDDSVNAYVEAEDARLDVAVQKQTIAADVKARGALTRTAVAAALETFRDNRIDAIALLAALLTAGLDPLLAAASVALAVAKKEPKLEPI
jgi:hypothetical protein